jgi:Nuclear protein 96
LLIVAELVPRTCICFNFSWLLLQTFKSLQIGNLGSAEENHVNISMAHQLEEMGLWDWSIFVLLFIKDSQVKKNLIFEILCRNLSPNTTAESIEIEKSLVNDYKIPVEWIHQIKATKTGPLKRHWETYHYLKFNNDWNGSHDLAINNILPGLINNGDFKTVERILKDLHQGCHHIMNWNKQGQFLLNFLNVYVRMKYGENLERQALCSEVIALCRATTDFPVKTPQQSLCISEISKQISFFVGTFASDIPNLTSILLAAAELVMPADYKQRELLKLLEKGILT